MKLDFIHLMLLLDQIQQWLEYCIAPQAYRLCVRIHLTLVFMEFVFGWSRLPLLNSSIADPAFLALSYGQSTNLQSDSIDGCFYGMFIYERVTLMYVRCVTSLMTQQITHTCGDDFFYPRTCLGTL